MILVIDNYDSFTYNLVDLLKQQTEVKVCRNDEFTPGLVTEMNPSGILISPGPGRPEDSGMTPEVVATFLPRLPILGICLGHQLLGQLLGGAVIRAQTPMHGKTSLVQHDGKGIFAGLPNPMTVMRYHSLVLDPLSLPVQWRVQAVTPASEIMGIRHKMYNLVGLQFHPESVLTGGGEKLIRNWVNSVCA